jgi:hypothetical protein
VIEIQGNWTGLNTGRLKRQNPQTLKTVPRWRLSCQAATWPLTNGLRSPPAIHVAKSFRWCLIHPWQESEQKGKVIFLIFLHFRSVRCILVPSKLGQQICLLYFSCLIKKQNKAVFSFTSKSLKMRFYN